MKSLLMKVIIFSLKTEIFGFCFALLKKYCKHLYLILVLYSISVPPEIARKSGFLKFSGDDIEMEHFAKMG